MAKYRPQSTYTIEIANKICVRLAAGESLSSVCRDPDFPCIATVFNWLRENDDFQIAYARAKAESADALFEELIDIADDGRNDWMENRDPDNPGYKLNGEHVNRSRLRVDTRKWAIARMKPKKYGDRLHTEHSGSIDMSSASDEDLDRRLAELEQKLAGS